MTVYYGLGDLIGLVVPLHFLLGSEDMWPICLGIGALVPAISLFFALQFLPESPRHLVITKNALEKARRSLEFYQGSNQSENSLQEIEQEMNYVHKNIQTCSWKTLLFERNYRKPLLIALMLSIGNQTAIFVSVIYSTPLLQTFGFSSYSATYATVSTGIAKFGSGLLTIAIVDHVSRFGMALTGSLGCSATMILITVTMNIFFTSEETRSSIVTSIFILQNCFYSFFSTSTALIGLEMFTQEARAKCVTLIQFVAWTVGFVVPLAFFPAFMMFGSFLALMPINVLLFLVSMSTWYFVPDTKRKSFLSVSKAMR